MGLVSWVRGEFVNQIRLMVINVANTVFVYFLRVGVFFILCRVCMVA